MLVGKLNIFVFLDNQRLKTAFSSRSGAPGVYPECSVDYTKSVL